MSWRCFFLGCQWRPFIVQSLGGELISCEQCQRCLAHRYVAAKKSPH